MADAETCERVSGVWANLLSAMLLLLIVRWCASVVMLLARRQCNAQWRGRRPSQLCSGRWLTAGADAAAARVWMPVGVHGVVLVRWGQGCTRQPSDKWRRQARPTGEINNGAGEAADSCAAS